MYDDFGLPFIPAKRIKGCLRDSLEELLYFFHSVDKDYKIFQLIDPDLCFGQRNERGNEFRGKSGLVRFSNLKIKGYESIKSNLHNLINTEKSYSKYFHSESVLENYTILKRSTSIDEETGSAKFTSLRTIRALKKNLIFEGELEFPENQNLEYALALAVSNFRSMGTSRNRGLGRIASSLKDEKGNTTENLIKELRKKCES